MDYQRHLVLLYMLNSKINKNAMWKATQTISHPSLLMIEQWAIDHEQRKVSTLFGHPYSQTSPTWEGKITLVTKLNLFYYLLDYNLNFFFLYYNNGKLK